jgi:type I restriction enzyme S subunit
MEVKPGYKRTELGVIPEDWEVKALKLISPRQSVGLVVNPSTYFERAGTVPILVGSNVSEYSIDWTAAKRITRSSNDLLAASENAR